jgi:hypothetical protein
MVDYLDKEFKFSLKKTQKHKKYEFIFNIGGVPFLACVSSKFKNNI